MYSIDSNYDITYCKNELKQKCCFNFIFVP